jgi:hypothetical protein
VSSAAVKEINQKKKFSLVAVKAENVPGSAVVRVETETVAVENKYSG